MNVVILGLNYSPEPIGIGPYTTDLARFLVGRGHSVHVIAGIPYYPDWALMDGFARQGARYTEEGVRITRVPHYIPSDPTGPKRILHHLSFAKNAARAMRKVEKVDLVLTIAPSLIAAPVALSAARRMGATSWLHIQDFEVEAAIATGLLAKGPGSAFGRRFEKAVISRFDHVSAISGPMVRKAVEKGANPVRAVELRNWSENIDDLVAASGAKIRQELNIPNGIIALYSGNLSHKQGVDLIAHAASSLRLDDGINLVVCGSGGAREQLENAASELPNLHIRDLQPRRRLGELLAMADMHILTQIEGAQDLLLPSKLTNMLASGKPVVATAADGSGLAAEVKGCGIVTPPGDAAAFAQAIRELASDGKLRSGLGKAALLRAQERWAPAVLLEEFALALENAAETDGCKRVE